MEEVNYVYVIEKWCNKTHEWVPAHYGTDDLEEMGELLCLMEKALPDKEFKLAQYIVSEVQSIHSYS